jgi:O-antigen ligase/tetratricopeptide (TPR) repeat protein
MNINKVNKVVLFLIILSFLAPLVVTNFSLFPFVFGKGIFFYLIVEILFLISLFIFFKAKINKFPRNILFWIVPFFYLLIIFLSSLGIDFYRSFWGNFERMAGGMYYLHLIIYFLILVSFLRNEERWYKVLKYFLISNILVNFFAITHALNINLGINISAGRIGGTLGNAGYLSSYLLISLILNFYALIKFKNLKTISIWTICLNVLTIFISATRGAILALFFVFVIYLIVAIFKRGYISIYKRRILVGLLIFLLLFSVSVVFFKDTKFIKETEVLNRLSSINLNDASVNHRIKMWDYSYEAFKLKPVFGWGLENYNKAFDAVYQGDMTEEWFDRSHNSFLDVLVMSGLVGLLFYLILIFCIFLIIIKLYQKKRIDFNIFILFLLGFLAYLIQNLFIFDTVNSQLVFILFIALLLYLDAKDQNYYKELININFFKKFNLIIIAVLVVGELFLFYNLIFIPTLTSSYAIKGINSQNKNNDLFKDYFNKALQYEQYGKEEILISLGDIVAKQIDIYDNYENVDFGIEEFNEYNIKNNTKLGIQLLSFYYAKSQAEEEYLDKIINFSEELIQNNPGRDEIYSHLGRALLKRGDFESSIDSFRKALLIKKNVSNYWNLHLAYLLSGDPEGSKKVFEEAFDQGVNFSREDLRKAYEQYYKYQYWESAEFILSKSIELFNQAEDYYSLAIVYGFLGKEDLGNNYLLKAIKMDDNIKKRVENMINK